MTGDDEEHSKEIKRNITTNFSKLTKSFPIDGLLADLYSKMVIDDGQKEAIQKKDLRKEKVSYLFSEVITPELDSGIHTKYDNLIKVMEDSDDTTAHHLARVLKGSYYTYMYAYICRYIVLHSCMCLCVIVCNTMCMHIQQLYTYNTESTNFINMKAQGCSA